MLQQTRAFGQIGHVRLRIDSSAPPTHNMRLPMRHTPCMRPLLTGRKFVCVRASASEGPRKPVHESNVFTRTAKQMLGVTVLAVTALAAAVLKDRITSPIIPPLLPNIHDVIPGATDSSSSSTGSSTASIHHVGSSHVDQPQQQGNSALSRPEIWPSEPTAATTTTTSSSSHSHPTATVRRQGVISGVVRPLWAVTTLPVKLLDLVLFPDEDIVRPLPGSAHNAAGSSSGTAASPMKTPTATAAHPAAPGVAAAVAVEADVAAPTAAAVPPGNAAKAASTGAPGMTAAVQFIQQQQHLVARNAADSWSKFTTALLRSMEDFKSSALPSSSSSSSGTNAPTAAAVTSPEVQPSPPLGHLPPGAVHTAANALLLAAVVMAVVRLYQSVTSPDAAKWRKRNDLLYNSAKRPITCYTWPGFMHYLPMELAPRYRSRNSSSSSSALDITEGLATPSGTTAGSSGGSSSSSSGVSKSAAAAAVYDTASLPVACYKWPGFEHDAPSSRATASSSSSSSNDGSEAVRTGEVVAGGVAAAAKVAAVPVDAGGSDLDRHHRVQDDDDDDDQWCLSTAAAIRLLPKNPKPAAPSNKTHAAAGSSGSSSAVGDTGVPAAAAGSSETSGAIDESLLDVESKVTVETAAAAAAAGEPLLPVTWSAAAAAVNDQVEEDKLLADAALDTEDHGSGTGTNMNSEASGDDGDVDDVSSKAVKCTAAVAAVEGGSYSVDTDNASTTHSSSTAAAAAAAAAARPLAAFEVLQPDAYVDAFGDPDIAANMSQIDARSAQRSAAAGSSSDAASTAAAADIEDSSSSSSSSSDSYLAAYEVLHPAAYNESFGDPDIAESMLQIDQRSAQRRDQDTAAAGSTDSTVSIVQGSSAAAAAAAAAADGSSDNTKQSSDGVAQVWVDAADVHAHTAQQVSELAKEVKPTANARSSSSSSSATSELSELLTVLRATLNFPSTSQTSQPHSHSSQQTSQSTSGSELATRDIVLLLCRALLLRGDDGEQQLRRALSRLESSSSFAVLLPVVLAGAMQALFRPAEWNRPGSSPSLLLPLLSDALSPAAYVSLQQQLIMRGLLADLDIPCQFVDNAQQRQQQQQQEEKEEGVQGIDVTAAAADGNSDLIASSSSLGLADIQGSGAEKLLNATVGAAAAKSSSSMQQEASEELEALQPDSLSAPDTLNADEVLCNPTQQQEQQGGQGKSVLHSWESEAGWTTAYWEGLLQQQQQQQQQQASVDVDSVFGDLNKETSPAQMSVAAAAAAAYTGVSSGHIAAATVAAEEYAEYVVDGCEGPDCCSDSYNKHEHSPSDSEDYEGIWSYEEEDDDHVLELHKAEQHKAEQQQQQEEEEGDNELDVQPTLYDPWCVDVASPPAAAADTAAAVEDGSAPALAAAGQAAADLELDSAASEVAVNPEAAADGSDTEETRATAAAAAAAQIPEVAAADAHGDVDGVVSTDSDVVIIIADGEDNHRNISVDGDDHVDVIWVVNEQEHKQQQQQQGRDDNSHPASDWSWVQTDIQVGARDKTISLTDDERWWEAHVGFGTEYSIDDSDIPTVCDKYNMSFCDSNYYTGPLWSLWESSTTGYSAETLDFSWVGEHHSKTQGTAASSSSTASSGSDSAAAWFDQPSFEKPDLNLDWHWINKPKRGQKNQHNQTKFTSGKAKKKKHYKKRQDGRQ